MSTAPHIRPRTIAVGGGKGGTGKSLLAANIGIFLATVGNRVVLVDAALGGASLHTFIGGLRPRRTLADVLSQNGPAHLDELRESTPVPGLDLIAGQRDPAWVANPRSGQIKQLATQIGELEADYVIIDLGPGTNGYTLDLFLLADVGVLVVVPEPTAVELGYRFMRAAFLRRLKHVGLAEAGKVPPQQLREFESGIPSPLDLYYRALDRDPELGAVLEEQLLTFAPQLVVNEARSKTEMDLGHAVASAGRRRLGLPIGYLGPVEYDEAVWVALKRKRPLLIEHPESRVAKCIEKVTRRLMGHDSDRHVAPQIGKEESYYELFEVAPTSSFEDIRRANRHAREVYGPDSVVVSGLYTRERLDELHRRLDEAYSVLMDAAKRKAYDHMLFPDGVPSLAILGESIPAVAAPEEPPRERPPMPALDAATIFSGALLKEIREARGIDLRDIAERTKIGMTYLRAIENETWGKLPAPVYVRGFLAEYAKIVGVEATRVLETFLDRYKKARATTEVEP